MMIPDSLRPCLAIVPARGGSKGLPGKNIRPLVGLPLIAHTLRCAALVEGLDRVVVSTDSEEIAGVARAAGGDVPFLRPAELAGDKTPTMPVLQHALDFVERVEGRAFASVLLLEPTSPCRLPEDVAKCFDALAARPDADGAVACSEPDFNPFWVGVVEREGLMARAFEGAFTRRQDVPRFLRINGAAYLWRTDFVRRAPAVWLEGKHVLVEMPEERAVSIDNLREFELAELMLSNGLLHVPWIERA